MPIVPAKCTSCGSSIKVDSDLKAAICDFCGTPFIIEKAINNYVTSNTYNADVINIVVDKDDFEITAGVLTGYTGSSTDIKVPDNVYEIGPSAFFDMKYIRSVTLPSTVRVIGECAFTDCLELESINIPESVTRIDDFAFSGCRSLTNVVLPGKLNYMGDGLFVNSGVRFLKIPESVKYIKNMSGARQVTIPSSWVYRDLLWYPPDNIPAKGQEGEWGLGAYKDGSIYKSANGETVPVTTILYLQYGIIVAQLAGNFNKTVEGLLDYIKQNKIKGQKLTSFGKKHWAMDVVFHPGQAPEVKSVIDEDGKVYWKDRNGGYSEVDALTYADLWLKVIYRRGKGEINYRFMLDGYDYSLFQDPGDLTDDHFYLIVACDGFPKTEHRLETDYNKLLEARMDQFSRYVFGTFYVSNVRHTAELRL